MAVRTLGQELLERRRPLRQMTVFEGPGVYAFYLPRPEELSPIQSDPDQVLYVGMTDDCLIVRNHFTHEHSGFSTFRRSLGAILKIRLGLIAVPRSAGSKSTAYRFAADDERRLSEWMALHLLGSQIPLPEHALELEKAAIRELRPPLNLIGWQNPQRAEIKALRSVCSAEAHATAQVATSRSGFG